VFFGVGLLAIAGLLGCNEETPIEKNKSRSCIRQCSDAGSRAGCSGFYTESAG